MRLLQDALAAYRRIGDGNNVVWALTTIGTTHYRQEDRAAALESYSAALEAARRNGDQSQIGTALNNQGIVHLEEGRLDQADAALREARETFVRIKLKSGEAHALSGLGQVLLARGDLAASRRELEASVTLWTAIGEQAPLAEGRLPLARLAWEEQRFAEAESEARAAAEVFAREEMPDLEAQARALESEAAAAQGHAAAAETAWQRAHVLAPKGQSASLRARVALAALRVGRGARAETRQTLAALADDRRLEARLRLEVRLALAAEESGALRESALAMAEADARARGFDLIVRQAAALRAARRR
jgi:tetratricopeptide (TPR) repeat protein